MKLLCVIPSYWPAFKYGGPIQSVHNLNKALVKKGVDITVYTTNAGLDGKVPVDQEVDVEGVKVIYFLFTKFFEFLGSAGWRFSLPLTKALKRNLKIFDLVYILSVWNYPVAVAAYYCRRYKKPYIISPRGLLYPRVFERKLWKKFPYYNILAKRDLRSASAVHYTTEDEAEKTRSSLELKNKAVVIPNGLDFSDFNNLPPRESLRERYPILKDKKIVLFLSRIHWKKGMDILIDAFSVLSKQRNDVHLLIVGNDEEGYGKKVKGWIMDYGMKYFDYRLKGYEVRDEDCAKVTFTGMMTGRGKMEAFAGSDIFVLPSYSESFGMAVVEAMACGLPVVVSNKVGIYKEIEKNKAGIVVDTNAESLYMGMKTLLENSQLKEEITNNGRQLVKEYYDIDRVADRVIAVYEEILKGTNYS